MRNLTWIIFLTLCTPVTQSIAQLVFHNESQRISADTISLMWAKADFIQSQYKKKNIACLRMDVVLVNTQTYLLPDGRFDVFVWQGGNWKNLYKKGFHGYNTGAKKFIFNNKLCSFGGTGFWHDHGDIIYFDPMKGEWELVVSSGNIPGGVAFLQDNMLCIKGKSCYDVALDTKKIKMYQQCPIPVDKEISHNLNTFEFSSYAVNLDMGLAFDKKNHNYATFDKKQFAVQGTELLHPNHLLLINKDSLIVYKKPMQAIKAVALSTFAANHFSYHGVNMYKTPLFILFAVSILLFSMVILWFRYSRDPEVQETSQHLELEPALHPLIQSFLTHQNSQLSADKLDQLLGISDISSQDTLRYKRAQLVKEINGHYEKSKGKHLIHRIPNQNDGRKYVYEIKP